MTMNDKYDTAKMAYVMEHRVAMPVWSVDVPDVAKAKGVPSHDLVRSHLRQSNTSNRGCI